LRRGGIAWPQRHHPDELSAVQHAMNLRLDRGDVAFWAEYQNEPLPEEHADDELLTADQIAAKVNGLRRGEVPIGATHSADGSSRNKTVGRRPRQPTDSSYTGSGVAIMGATRRPLSIAPANLASPRNVAAPCAL